MDAERWQRLSPLLDALLELEPEARTRRLEELRGEDAALAGELEALVALEAEHGDFLSEPLVMPPAGVGSGSEVGPYRLDRLLGEGGMGQVWLASRADGLYQRRVALKLLRPGLTSHDLRLRFTREREILARLAHPHIARLLDAGISAEGLPYLALEYVDGTPITDYCRDNRIPLAQRLGMFLQVCEAASHAHANLIVHRDLKPSNILVTPAGEVRLLDFGIAKLLDSGLSEGAATAREQTGTGMRAFTLHYAAPEQIRGEPVTTMTDVYSLGVVLYELLTDRRPYRLKRHSDAEWEEAILTADPLRPSVGVLRDTATARDRQAQRRHSRVLAGDLDNIALKALAKRPEQRYPSVEALAQDIRRYRAGRPVLARPQKLGYRLHKFVARHRWALASALLATAALTAALALIAWQAQQAVAEAARAQAMQDFMVGLFENASGRSRGEPMDLDQLLDDAVARGNQQLAREPRARAELLGVIARLHIGLGNYPQAQILLDQQAEIIGQTADIPNSLQLEALTQRGRVLRLLGEPEACIEAMQPAQSLVRREQARLPPQVAAFHVQLGHCRHAVGERQGARQSFERALVVRRAIGGDEAGTVEVLMDLAVLQADDNPAAALVAYELARTQLHDRVGPAHVLNIRLGRELAALQTAAGRFQPARETLRQALQVALDIHGPGHEETLGVRGQLAGLLFDTSRFDEAEIELREVHRLRRARLGPGHPELVSDHIRLGRLAWERDDLSTALAELREALQIARSAGEPEAEIRSLVALADVLRAAGRAGAARPVLVEAQQLRNALADVDSDAGNDVDWLLGDVEITLGDTLVGQARLQQAMVLAQRRYGETQPDALRVEVVSLRLRALDGDLQAMERLEAIARGQDQARFDHRRRAIGWQASVAVAEARCRNGEAEAGAAALDQLSSRLQSEQPDGSALRREIEATRGRCGGR
ncbi:serine/threonine-protein kinase [Marilutibacter alkalisoli]|uniref:Protein kinase n=1 Tax=Marilutibacter alkalisoli TaxID=2591633 RepID=A0A514BVY4_9GAMM|nr:serine/threonine-protein kinase [Lysobacter alkalisoli]QDH71537.1 protein kinase [Lysobacter alkalisoli]